MIPPKTWADIEAVLEEQFPKDDCEERGGALVLLAVFRMLLDSKEKEIKALKKRS